MKKFTLGVVSGISSLALAIPLLAQVSSAASGDTSASAKTDTRPAPSQECILALADKDGNFLSTIDTVIAAQKSATLTHKNALTAAANITDDAARKTAVQKAHEDFRTAMKTVMESRGDNTETMEALKEACGDSMPMGGGHMMGGFGGKHDGPGMRGRGPAPAKFAEKLGMTEAELKTAIESGKTIEEIAEEKGVELPARPAKGKRGMFGPRGTDAETPTAE